jgi:MFS family permease
VARAKAGAGTPDVIAAAGAVPQDPLARRRLVCGALAVGLVLADSSVVTLGLPEILDRFDVSVERVAQVLTSFNVALALAALPAALVARRAPRATAGAGLAVFAAASAACALAGTFHVLIAARVVQALGGAAAIVGVLALLASTTRGRATWTLAGIVGAAAGPAAGGILTQAAGWRAIFWAQVPLAVLALAAVLGPPPAVVQRPLVADLRARLTGLAGDAALGLLSAALSAALFLLVLLLVDGWRFSPLGAAVVVTAMPAAAIAASAVALPPRPAAAAGALLVAGGLGGLAYLPSASALATLPPQLLLGLGLGLGLEALTGAALVSRTPLVGGAAAIAARHAGVVLGLALLAPVLASDLVTAEQDALRAGTAIVLDANVPAGSKLSLARDVLATVSANRSGAVPDVRRAFRNRTGPQYAEVERALVDDVERAATHAFSRSFRYAALLALAALLPLPLLRARGRTR